jgi:hypothetical protein
MDWFERITGFRETSYDETRARLRVEARSLRSLVNGKSYGIGELELVSLHELRERVKNAGAPVGRLRVRSVTGDVQEMHQSGDYARALFQVASQFDLLEMVGPSVTPEDGVTRYMNDPTQGPACAIAAGAATIYRNYFAPLAGSHGQTAKCQFDGLNDLGMTLGKVLNKPVDTLWHMQNGYALCTEKGLGVIGDHLGESSAEEIDALRGKLRIGLHRDVEVTISSDDNRPFVSQALCSALPITYTRVPSFRWKAFASLVLEAAYEATLLAAALNARRGASNVVLLTSLGGGAFGNPETWIIHSMRRAFNIALQYDLDVKLVSYRKPSRALIDLANQFS